MENKLIVGTAQFGMPYGINNSTGQPGLQTITDILNLAGDNGIVCLDSAEAYGSSHQQIGLYHQQSNYRFKVITKFNPKRSDLPVKIFERVQKNLQDLNISSLEAYMFHSFADYQKYIDVFETDLSALQQASLIKHLGVSVYTNYEFEQVLADSRIGLVQVPFNILDNAGQKGHLLAKANQKGVTVHVRSVYLQGLFFMDTEKLPEKLKLLKPSLTKIKSLALENNTTIEQLCLQYVLKQTNIQGVIIGVETSAQLQANLAAARQAVPDAVLKEIETIEIENAELLNPSTWYV